LTLGNDDYRQLGHATQETVHHPRHIAKSFSSVSAGTFHTLFLTGKMHNLNGINVVLASGLVYGAGSNSGGKIGQATFGNFNSRTFNQDLRGITQISAGFVSSFVIGMIYMLR
jgi:alpha-tubulin suppressor-like RCC1 family protein